MDSPYFYVGEKRLAPKWTQSAFIVESSQKNIKFWMCPHVDTSNFRQNRIKYLQFRDPLSQNHTTPMESQIATPVDFSQF